VALRFERLTEADLPMLAEWLNRPHVAEWWADCKTLAEVRKQYLPTLTDDSSVLPHVAYLESLPFGYIQSYVAADAGDGWWPDKHDPGVRGIDQFLADAHSLGHGLGTEMVRQFVQFLFEDPRVTRIQADPAPTNLRAIRCYEKAAFDGLE
jgi:aminoglycoside 6'-N-acetyltransferase Ib